MVAPALVVGTLTVAAATTAAAVSVRDDKRKGQPAGTGARSAAERVRAAAGNVGKTALNAGKGFVAASFAGLTGGASVGGGLSALFGSVGGPVMPLIALSGAAIGANGGLTMAGTAAALVGGAQVTATAAQEAFSLADLIPRPPGPGRR